jgi:lactate permease
MQFVLAILPIALVIVCLVWLKLSSKLTMLLAWAAAVIIALSAWQMSPLAATAWTTVGALKALDIILIIFGAILLLNAMRTSGGMKAIEGSLLKLSTDARVQALLIGWLFVSFMEGAAGFGVPAALAAPLLVGMGWRPLASIVFALICNGTATAFGAIGTPMLTELAIAGPGINAQQTILLTAGIHAVIGLAVPLVGMWFLLRLQGIKRGGKRLREIAPFALFTAAAFTVPYFVIALFFGAELPSIVGAVIGLILTIGAIKLKLFQPKRKLLLETHQEIRVDEQDEAKIGIFRAWLPYILIVAILVITRLPGWPLGDWLKSLTLNFTSLFGVAGADHAMQLLYSPGVWFLVVALATIVIHRVHHRHYRRILGATVRQISGAAIALVFGVALTQIMINSGNAQSVSMVGAIAAGLAGVFGPLYVVVAPLLGALGGFVAGSNTVSNMLFTPSQLASAASLGLNAPLILALQCVGGGFGNLLAVNNIVAAGATVGLTGEEGKVIRINFAPVAAFLGLTIVIGLGLAAVFD